MEIGTAEVKSLRARAASNSVKKGALFGVPGHVVAGYVTLRLVQKYGIPDYVAAAGLSCVATAWQSLVSYFSRGGRKGEAE